MTRRPLVVAALGGNALLRRGEQPTAESQRENVAAAVEALAKVALGWDLVVTHGNGPQVGLLALRDAALTGAPSDPLDVLGAESEGMIGYLLDQGLANALPGREVATLLTQVRVDLGDPAFSKPSKPIGPVYTRREAERLAAERGWSIAPDGEHWRRVVPSPEPRQIIELPTIERLVRAGVLVVCVGGGGIPVAVDASGGMRGVEAVIDKDLASAVLAERLRADALLLLTDVPAVEVEHGTPSARAISKLDVDDLRLRDFEAGSMRPKLQALARYVRATGGLGAIGALADAQELLERRAGTRVTSTAEPAPPHQKLEWH